MFEVAVVRVHHFEPRSEESIPLVRHGNHVALIRLVLQLRLRVNNTAVFNAQSQLIRVNLMTEIFVIILRWEPRRRVLGGSIGLAMPSYLHTRASTAEFEGLLAVLCQLLQVDKLPLVLVDESLLRATSLVEEVTTRWWHVDSLQLTISGVFLLLKSSIKRFKRPMVVLLYIYLMLRWSIQFLLSLSLLV